MIISKSSREVPQENPAEGLLRSSLGESSSEQCSPDPINNLCSPAGNRFQKNILLIVQYKYLKSCSEDLFSRIWSSAQDYAVLVLLLNPGGFSFPPDQYDQAEMFCTTVVPVPKEHLGGGLDIFA